MTNDNKPENGTSKRGLPVTTHTANGHAISKDVITDAQGNEKPVWCVVVDGVARYSNHTGIAPSKDSRYLPLDAFLAQPKQQRQRRVKKDKNVLTPDLMVAACMEWSASDVQELIMRLANIEAEKRERVKAEKKAMIKKLEAEIAAMG